LGGQILALLATSLFISWSLGWTLSPSPQLLEGWLDAPWRFYSEASFYELGLLLTVFVLVYSRVATWASIGVRHPDLQIPFLIAAVAACYFILHFAINPLSMSASRWVANAFGHQSMGVDEITDPIQLGLSLTMEAIRGSGPWASVLVVLWMGVLVPIIEELFFRGVAFKALLGSLPAWMALLGQALLFAVMHFEMGRLIYLLAFGLILGLLVRRTSSLLPAVLLHVAVNATSLVMALA
jgi:membrane protease YdiL (CAAX protease family)